MDELRVHEKCIMNGMDGQGYEKYCAQWLKKHGYHDISLTRTTGDQGIDILAFRHGKQYGFQCKYYERPVGNEAVQQAYSGAAYYDCDVPVVITNSTFTRAAIDLAEETGVILMDQIDPDQKKHLFSFTQILSIITSFEGVWAFSQYSRHPMIAFNDISVWSDLALIAGGLCGLYAGNHLVLCLLAVILDLTYLILDFTILYQNRNLFSLLFWCLVLILYGCLSVHAILMVRRKNNHETRIIRHEIHQEIQQKVNDLGKHLEVIFSEELHCVIHLESAKHQSDGTSTFVFHTSKDVRNDLPLLEYSLNQYAEHDQINDRYSLTADTSRSYTLVIARKN